MENQRIRLSKQLLKNALIELLQEKDLGKIKINEICEKASINRTTFYKYYGSQYDLFSEIEQELLTNLSEYIGNSSNEPADTKTLSDIFYYLRDNKMTCLTIINNSPKNAFLEKVINMDVLGFMDEIFKKSTKNKENWRYTKIFSYQGCYAVLLDWLEDDKGQSPEKITEIILELIFKMIG